MDAAGAATEFDPTLYSVAAGLIPALVALMHDRHITKQVEPGNKLVVTAVLVVAAVGFGCSIYALGKGEAPSPTKCLTLAGLVAPAILIFFNVTSYTWRWGRYKPQPDQEPDAKLVPPGKEAGGKE